MSYADLHLDAKTTIARTSIAAWNALMRSDPQFGHYALSDIGRSAFLAVFTVVSDGKWQVGGKLHRTDGPAITYVNGDEEWYERGRLHRADGKPAVIRANGGMVWNGMSVVNAIALAAQRIYMHAVTNHGMSAVDYIVSVDRRSCMPAATENGMSAVTAIVLVGRRVCMSATARHGMSMGIYIASAVQLAHPPATLKSGVSTANVIASAGRRLYTPMAARRGMRTDGTARRRLTNNSAPFL